MHVQVLENGRQNLRYRDGQPVCLTLSKVVKSSVVNIVRTIGFARLYVPSICNIQASPAMVRIIPNAAAGNAAVRNHTVYHQEGIMAKHFLAVSAYSTVVFVLAEL
jgi:hypothetical protein